jgi:hypothetical protein
MTSEKKSKARHVAKGTVRSRKGGPFRPKHKLKQKALVHWHRNGRKEKLDILAQIIASLSEAEVTHAKELLKRRSQNSERGKVETHALMVQAIPLENALQKWDFIPHAVIAHPLEAFTRHVSSRITSGHDALDEYSGVAFAIDGAPFAVMHYKGHPPETSTIYFPRDLDAIPEITELIGRIVSRFELPNDSIIWQRKDNPEL